MCEWIITNKKRVEKNGLELSFKKKQFKFYYKGTEIYSFDDDGDNVSIVIDGYVLPRMEYANEYSRYTSESLIKELYTKYHLGFINYIKGNFVIIIIKGEKFNILTDRIGIRKCFYYIKGQFPIFYSAY